MNCEDIHRYSYVLQLLSIVPFIVGFAMSDWVFFDSAVLGRREYGLWSGCNHSSPKDSEFCESLDRLHSSEYFYACRTLFCAALFFFGCCLVYCFTIKWAKKDTKYVIRNLFLQLAVTSTTIGGVVTFDFAKEEYEEDNTVDSHYGLPAILVWVVAGVQSLAVLITTLPLLKKHCSCDWSCDCECLRSIRIGSTPNHSARNSPTARTSATTTTTTTAATTTSGTRMTSATPTNHTAPSTLGTAPVRPSPFFTNIINNHARSEISASNTSPGNTSRSANGFNPDLDPNPPRYEDISTDSRPQPSQSGRSPSAHDGEAPPPSSDHDASESGNDMNGSPEDESGESSS